jgi:uncharacterized protein YybS (DUF2232 family)
VVGRRFAVWLLGLITLVALVLAGHLHPLANLLAGVWLPLPILLVGWRLGDRWALLLAAAAGLALFASRPTLAGVLDHLNFAELLVLGCLLSTWRNRGYPAPQVIGLTVLGVLVVSGAFLALQTWLAGMGPGELINQKAKETAENLSRVMAEAGMSSEGLSLMGLPRPDWIALVKQILPALVVINTTLVAWLNLVTMRQVALAAGEEELEVPLTQWFTPEWVIFVFLTAGFTLLVPVPAVRLVSLNLLLILGFLYFFQGLAVLAAFFERFHLPWFLRLMGYLLAFMNPLVLLVMMVGLLDLWLDFRRLHRPRE